MFHLIHPTNRSNDLFDFFNLEPVIDNRGDTQFVEEKDKYVFSLDLPGFKKEDVKLDIQDNYISIKAKREQDYSKDAKVYHKRRSSSEKTVHYNLPKDVLAEKVSAKLENGLLQVDFPKTPETKPKQITIQ